MGTVMGIIFILLIVVIAIGKHAENDRAKAIRANAAARGQRLTRSQSKALAKEQMRLEREYRRSHR